MRTYGKKRQQGLEKVFVLSAYANHALRLRIVLKRPQDRHDFDRLRPGPEYDQILSCRHTLSDRYPCSMGMLDNLPGDGGVVGAFPE